MRRLYKSIVLFFLYLNISSAGIGFSIPSIEDSIIIYNQPKYEKFINNEINLLVWNIFKGDKKTFGQDYHKISKNKDLILLQETVDTENVVQELKSNPEFEHIFFTSFIFWNGGKRTGVSTGSNVKPFFFNFIRSKKREYKFFTPKTLSISKYKLKDDKTLLVFNIHSLNWVTDKIHFEQVKEVEKIIEKHSGPIIFAGDFNTKTEKRMKNIKGFMSKHGLKEIIFKNGDRRMKASKTALILDHIFVRDLRYKNAHIPYKINGSDHRPMVTTLIYSPK